MAGSNLTLDSTEDSQLVVRRKTKGQQEQERKTPKSREVVASPVAPSTNSSSSKRKSRESVLTPSVPKPKPRPALLRKNAMPARKQVRKAKHARKAKGKKAKAKPTASKPKAVETKAPKDLAQAKAKAQPPSDAQGPVKPPSKAEAKAAPKSVLAKAAPNTPVDGSAQKHSKRDAEAPGHTMNDAKAPKSGSDPPSTAGKVLANAKSGSEVQGLQKSESVPVKVERQGSNVSLGEVAALLNRASTQDMTEPAALQELAQAATMAAAQQKEEKKARKRSQEELKLHARRMRFYRTLDSALLSPHMRSIVYVRHRLACQLRVSFVSLAFFFCSTRHLSPEPEV